MNATPPKLGVSACLLGANVRYDGATKLNSCITDTLGPLFIFVPVCPEVECGLPTPREAMRLEGDPANLRLITINSRVDKTEQLLHHIASSVTKLGEEELCGFIFKERSPSCGLATVPLQDGSIDGRFTAGLFAAEISRRFPLMPVEEAENLGNPTIRKNFIEQVLLYRRELDRQKISPHPDSYPIDFSAGNYQ